jgi:hypothetical protein
MLRLRLLTDPRAASIFAHFAHNKIEGLLRIAEEIDAEYEEDLAAEHDDSTRSGAGIGAIRIVVSDAGEAMSPIQPKDEAASDET